MRQWAKKLEADAKAGHLWTNRTGAAEEALQGKVEVASTGRGAILRLLLESVQPPWYHRRPSEDKFHGYYLEVAHGGQYAIIRPTLERNWPAIQRQVRKAR